MRVFIAIEFPDSIKSELAQSAEIIHTLFPNGTYAGLDSYHLTLAFLGEVDEVSIPRLTAVLDRLSASASEAIIDRLGCFPGPKGAVVWRRMESSNLTELQQQLCSLLSAEGFSLESRPFVPHITLARRIPVSDASDLDPLNRQLYPLCFSSNTVTLFQSEFCNGKHRYRPLYRKHLPIL